MTGRLSSPRVRGAAAAAWLVIGCLPGSDAPPSSTGSGGATGSAGTSDGSGSGGSGGGPGTGGASAGGSGAGSGGSGSAGTSGAAGTVGAGGGGGSSAGSGGSAGGRGGSAGGRGGAGAAAEARCRALPVVPGSRDRAAPAPPEPAAGPPPAPMPSAGCSKTTTQALNQWVAGTLTVSGSSRTTAVRLPTGYDPNRAYPVIVLLHGCGGGTNNVPMENATGSNAILVRGTGSASGTCWSTTASGADVAFVDAMVADVKARFCADEGRFFTVGYSSGSWLINQLTCIRASALRGAATVTGGEAASGNCGGPVARMFVHDKDDTDNVISGSERARDRQLTQNGCDKSMAPVATDPSPCVRYPGCPAAYPVVWCATSGQRHNRQDNWVPAAFWNFFKAF